MKLIYKNIGETPLEALEKFRQSEPSLKEETLSYIGRLDPMAEGEMIVLVGKEENQKRDEYLNFDKEYVAEFLVGFATDAGDLLGLVQKSSADKTAAANNKDETFQKNLTEKIATLPEKLSKITEQKFPWFSSKHVFGRALFDWFKAGQQKEIERPSKQIKIYSAELDESRTIESTELLNYLTDNINKVKGDFRQSEILKKWQGILKSVSTEKTATAKSPVVNFPTAEFPISEFPISEFPISEFPIFTLKLKVSTGTYIRGLTEEIEKELGVPVVLFSLKRSKIYLN
jgi:tRNA U55 pseudouridine synthase TruB